MQKLAEKITCKYFSSCQNAFNILGITASFIARSRLQTVFAMIGKSISAVTLEKRQLTFVTLG